MEGEPLRADRDDRGRGASDTGRLHAGKGEQHLCRPPSRKAGLGAPACGRRPSSYRRVSTHRRKRFHMEDLALEVVRLRDQLERTTALTREVAAKRIADRMAIKGFASLLISKCDAGVGPAVANILDNTAREFRERDQSSEVFAIVGDSLEEWAADVRGFAPPQPSPDLRHIRQTVYELAAKHAATRIIMVSLAAYVGRADGNISTITREIEQTVRDIRRSARGESREAYVLIGDEIARIADGLRKYE